MERKITAVETREGLRFPTHAPHHAITRACSIMGRSKSMSAVAKVMGDVYSEELTTSGKRKDSTFRARGGHGSHIRGAVAVAAGVDKANRATGSDDEGQGEWTSTLYDPDKMIAPRGLKEGIREALEEEGWEFEVLQEIEDGPETFSPTLTFPIDKLRDYQVPCMSPTERIGRVHVAVAGGKSLMMSLILNHWKRNAIILCHSKDLVIQNARFVKEYLGIDASIAMGGEFKPAPIVCATPDTLLINIEAVKEWGCHTLLADEGDLASSERCQRLIAELKPVCAYEITGTGNAGGYRNKLLEATFGKEIVVKDLPELQRDGFVAQGRVLMYEVPGRLRTDIGMTEAYKLGLVEYAPRNELIVKVIEKAVAAGKGVKVLVGWEQHGQILHEMLKKVIAGVKFCHGKTDAWERSIALSRFQHGEIKVLIGTGIWDRGINVEEIDVLVLASGRKKERLIKQQTGRALRKREGKDTGWIIDFIDKQHGMLLKHSYERLEVYESSGFKITRMVRSEKE